MKPNTAEDIERVLQYVSENCDHVCTSNCKRKGCHCTCGEFHDYQTFEAAERIESWLATYDPKKDELV